MGFAGGLGTRKTLGKECSEDVRMVIRFGFSEMQGRAQWGVRMMRAQVGWGVMGMDLCREQWVEVRWQTGIRGRW